MQYNFAVISHAQNELQSRLSQSTKGNTNLKARLNKKQNKTKVYVVFFCVAFLCCIFYVEFFRVVHFVLYLKYFTHFDRFLCFMFSNVYVRLYLFISINIYISIYISISLSLSLPPSISLSLYLYLSIPYKTGHYCNETLCSCLCCSRGYVHI